MSCRFFNCKRKLCLKFEPKMNVISIWISFILLMSLLEELDQAHFFLFNLSTFYLLYLCNKLRPNILSFRSSFLLANFSNIILWYVAFVYNDFLCITPMPHEIFIGLFFLYFCLTSYIFLSKLLNYL